MRALFAPLNGQGNRDRGKLVSTASRSILIIVTLGKRHVGGRKRSPTPPDTRPAQSAVSTSSKPTLQTTTGSKTIAQRLSRGLDGIPKWGTLEVILD